MQSYFKNKWLPYLLLLPTFVVLVVFLFYPAAETFRLSLYRVQAFGLRKKFAGIGNFQSLLQNSDYVSSFLLSLLFSACVVIIGLIIALLIAILLNQRLKGIKVYRSLLLWPYAFSPAIAGAVFGFLFSPANGFVTSLFSSLFGTSPKWLTDGHLTFGILITAAVWKNLGYNIIFYLAGLQQVQQEAIESASIDGAGAVRRFIHIVFPLLSPTTFFLLIMNIIYSYFGAFGLIDVLTQGGPANATNILIYQLYRDFFVNSVTGLAAAESVVLFVLVVVLMMIQFRTTGKRVYYQ